MVKFPPWKTALTILVCLFGILWSAPNLVDRQTLDGLPGWLPSRQVNLGLDLQGGSHLLLEVDVDTVTRDRMNGLVEDLRRRLRTEGLAYTQIGVEGASAVVRLREGFDRETARRVLLEADEGLTLDLGADGVARLTRTAAALAAEKTRAVEQSIEIIRRRVDETGTREPNIQRQGEGRILVQLPGVRDPERVKALLGTTAKLTFRFIDEQTSLADALGGRLPASSEVLPGDRTDARAGGEVPRYVVQKRVMVSGENLTNAQPSFTSQEGQWAVSFTFDSVGARRFGDATTQNVGKLFAIVLDGKVLSAPVIREPITGGRGQISGSFNAQSANDLAILLRAGALPAPLTIIEERTVGPDLGSDSIEAGVISSLVALAAVCALMILVYGLFGVFSVIALLVNLLLIVALMGLIGATLTLPGIAGIVLTMGMALDANVLIFERMRDEIRLGRSPIAAIDQGFTRAFGTILDSNLTTLIATVILVALGSGPVRGFGVTLSLGIMTSMFTAIMLTRGFVLIWYWRARPKVLRV